MEGEGRGGKGKGAKHRTKLYQNNTKLLPQLGYGFKFGRLEESQSAISRPAFSLFW